jgi:osmotically-inducible protein OsmY
VFPGGARGGYIDGEVIDGQVFDGQVFDGGTVSDRGEAEQMRSLPRGTIGRRNDS